MARVSNLIGTSPCQPPNAPRLSGAACDTPKDGPAQEEHLHLLLPWRPGADVLAPSMLVADQRTDYSGRAGGRKSRSERNEPPENSCDGEQCDRQICPQTVQHRAG